MEAMVLTRDDKIFIEHERRESTPILLLRGRLFARMGFNIDPIDGSALVIYEEFQGNFEGLKECFQRLRETGCE